MRTLGTLNGEGKGWQALSRSRAAAMGVRLTEWLAVREDWQDIRFGSVPQSGGYVCGVVLVRHALGWVYAPDRMSALKEAPEHASTVISRLSLETEDRDRWLAIGVGQSRVYMLPLFGPSTRAAQWCVARARSIAAELGAAPPTLLQPGELAA